MRHTSTLLLLVLTVFFTHATLATDLSGTISANTTLTLVNSPYNITGHVTVNSGVTLTIEDGVEVRFGGNLYMEVRGILNATGAMFTADTDSPSPGFYQGIYVGFPNDNVIYKGEVNLDNCVIEYASNTYLRHGELNLTNNCILRDFTGFGVNIHQRGILNMANSTITNTSYPIYMSDNFGGNFTFGENVDISNNTNNFIFINFRYLNEVMHWPNLGIPYYFDSQFNITQTRQHFIEPPVVVQGNTGAYFSINGKINAIGSENSPIFFTTRDGQNYWQGINVLDNAIDPDCIFRNCIFEKAANNWRNHSAMAIFDASPTIDSCAFRSNVYNLEIQGRSLPAFSNNSFGASIQNSAFAYNISMDWTAEPTFSNDTLHF
ncbi:MAG: hypothetical protein N4A46_06990, partial [Schleiferiaceae bacterium]|nr:hypothetical protein [Schleiferiaceae bacterium]